MVLTMLSRSTAKSRAWRTILSDRTVLWFWLKNTPNMRGKGVDMTVYLAAVAAASLAAGTGEMVPILSTCPAWRAARAFSSSAKKLKTIVLMCGSCPWYLRQTDRSYFVGMPPASRLMEDILYGPAPIGSMLYWLNINCSSETSPQMCFGRMPTVVLVIKGVYGCLRLNCISVGDISDTATLTQSARRGLLRAGSWIFWMVKATSAAVSSRPSWKRTP